MIHYKTGCDLVTATSWYFSLATSPRLASPHRRSTARVLLTYNLCYCEAICICVDLCDMRAYDSYADCLHFINHQSILWGCKHYVDAPHQSNHGRASTVHTRSSIRNRRLSSSLF
ncbi:hypothetical protein NP493_574g00040 [Ridgeia piscesae]|uniref:Uncharacterized protein n=1 Tax=Ridgeia piscesae TaxID=27915 RepID=A0AAD9NRG1_RIDPI|nr:hypothetical protein NP493_574g00040 [Ridgeia piscesae]